MANQQQSWNEPTAIAAILAGCPRHVGGPQDVQWVDPPAGFGMAISSDHISAGDAYPGEDVRSLVRRGLVEALSDLAAAGARFLGVQVDLSAPDDFTVADFLAVGAGLNDGLSDYDGSLLQASNTTRGHFGVSFTVIGTAPKTSRLGRHGAQAGDLVFVSGPFGGWNAALALLNAPKKQLSEAEWFRVRDAFVDYYPELRLGQTLARSGIASACIDANDSLDRSLRDLLAPLGLDADIDEFSVPINPVARFAERELSLDPLMLAITGVSGDDRLVFTVPTRRRRELEDLLAASGHHAIVIGTLSSGSGAVRYSSIGSRSTSDDNRFVSIYTSAFWSGVDLRCPRFAGGGRIVNGIGVSSK